ncbi:MAG TPA: hypothetical protein P5168_03875, partial [Candidatus Methanomethylicus sp.]|nr:hypothetical protein [Candidatus Methanomethylicus sp.]
GTTGIIFRRSVNLSKTYLLLGIFMGAMAVGMSALGLLTPPSSEIPLDLQTYFSLFFIGLASMTAVLMATPVLLLFVYDKNNGVLEYMLSIGMTQSNLFRSYLQAALALAGIILVAEVAGNAALTLLLGGATALLPSISVLTIVLGVSAVAFTTVLMMAFSSLQKQRVGANQPLGIGLGVLLIMPSFFVPALLPEMAVTIVFANAAVVIALSLAVFLLAGRLIKREKLLP